jgi:hypothetical protein
LKSRIERGPIPDTSIEISSKVNGILPTELLREYEEAKKAGIFIDSNFPQN